jgi:hypothetical protein
LAHQAHVSAAWLGEGFGNGQVPAVPAGGFIQRDLANRRYPAARRTTRQRFKNAIPQG